MIKNWKPISLNNIDVKLISKVLAKVIKKYLPLLVFSNQPAYVYKKIISEGGQLISGILEIANLLKIKPLLLRVDTEEAFHSVDH